MTDVVIVKKGSRDLDGTEIIDIPVKFIDNGDGTYSEAGSSGSGGGGSGNSPTFQDLLYTDDTNVQFIYKDTGTTTPIINAYLIPSGASYVVGANPRPYAVTNMAVTSIDIGTKVDAAATTDTGTFSLIALFKRSLQKLTALISTQTITIEVAPVVAIGATSVASSAIAGTTNRVILNATTDCWVSLGQIPVAVARTSGSFFLSAGIPSYPILVPAGTKVAVIQDISAGFLSIIETV